MTQKKRVKIHNEVASEILYKNEHTCCLCKEQGKPVQIHHINEDPSDNSMENLAVVCVECQNKIHRKGGIEKSYLPDEVKKHKILWEEAVANRRKYLGTPPIVRKIKEFDPKTGIERVIEEKIPYTNGLAFQAINITPSVSLNHDKELIIEEVKKIVTSELGSEKLISILNEVKRTPEIKVDDVVILSRICLLIGDSKFHIGDYGLAEIFFKEALSYAKSAKESEIIKLCLHELGASVGMQGRHNEALSYFRSVTKMAINNSAAWLNISVALVLLNKNKEAMSACHRAIGLGKKAEEWGTVATAYYNMGNAQRKLDGYKDAIDSYLKAIEFGEKAEEWDTVAGAYNNMGNALKILERYKDAIDSYLKAIEFGEKAEEWGTVASAYFNMGNAQKILERDKDAIDSYLKAIEFGEKAEEWYTVAGAYNNMGNAHDELVEYQDAINSYLKAIEGRNFLADKGERIFPDITWLACILGSKNIKDKNHTQAKRFAGVLAKIYLDGEKDGMVELIRKVMEGLESEMSKEEDINAFKQFKKYFEGLKNKGRK